MEVVRRAADEGPEISELWASLQRNRRAGAAMVVRHLATLPPVPEGFDAERATDIIWVFNDPVHYDALVNQRGWAEDDYADWTADQMRHGLGIGSPASRDPGSSWNPRNRSTRTIANTASAGQAIDRRAAGSLGMRPAPPARKRTSRHSGRSAWRQRHRTGDKIQAWRELARACYVRQSHTDHMSMGPGPA